MPKRISLAIMKPSNFLQPCVFLLTSILLCVCGSQAFADNAPSADKIAEWRKAAEQGDADAQSHLGFQYLLGEGVPKNDAEGAKWVSKAAEQGHANAQLNLGGCYTDGRGVPMDKKEAFKWYSKAASQGNADAQFHIGVSYLKGEGVPKDDAEAVRWLTKSAEQGQALAQLNLGACYGKGTGIPKDAKEGFKWMMKAAEQGQAAAQLNLGICYANGDGVIKNDAEATKWWRKAAEQGLDEAQCDLGSCYLKGAGVPKDQVLAYMWLNLSAAAGDATPAKARDALEKEMSPEQIEKAQTMSREWRPNNATPEPSPSAVTQEKLNLTAEEQVLRNLFTEMYIRRNAGGDEMINLLIKYGISRKGVWIPTDATSEQSKDRLRNLTSDLLQLAHTNEQAAALVTKFNLAILDNRVQERQRLAAAAKGNEPNVSEAVADDSFALIPAGEFTMGDTLDGDKNATPHNVSVSAFHMQKMEVSKAQWDEVREWGLTYGYSDLPEGKGKAADHPVQTVSWYDVVKWCNARSEMERLTPCYYTDKGQTLVYRSGNVDLDSTLVNWSGNGYRLPTEAEWEKAARGGLADRRFPSGDTISHEAANFSNNGKESYQAGTAGFHPACLAGSAPYTSPVASFAANGYGLHDMAGNVCEWCWDREGRYPATSQTDPRGAAAGSCRELRGGAWGSNAQACRVTSRNFIDPGAAYYNYGFRCVRSSMAPGPTVAETPEATEPQKPASKESVKPARGNSGNGSLRARTKQFDDL